MSGPEALLRNIEYHRQERRQTPPSSAADGLGFRGFGFSDLIENQSSINNNYPQAPPKPSQGYSMLRNNASGPEIGLPGRILAGLLPESTEIGPPAGGPISVLSRSQSGRNPARKADLRPGSIIA